MVSHDSFPVLIRPVVRLLISAFGWNDDRPQHAQGLEVFSDFHSSLSRNLQLRYPEIRAFVNRLAEAFTESQILSVPPVTVFHSFVFPGEFPAAVLGGSGGELIYLNGIHGLVSVTGLSGSDSPGMGCSRAPQSLGRPTSPGTSSELPSHLAERQFQTARKTEKTKKLKKKKKRKCLLWGKALNGSRARVLNSTLEVDTMS